MTIWTLLVPARPDAPVFPTLPDLPSEKDPLFATVLEAREARTTEYATAAAAWALEMDAITAVDKQPVKAVHGVVDIGGGHFRADITLDIGGIVERCFYVYAPAGYDVSAAHKQLVDLHASGVFDQHIVSAPPPTKEELIAYAADVRWRKASGGVTVPIPGGGTFTVPSDDVAYGRLKGATQDLAAGIINEPITIVIGAAVVSASKSIAETLYGAISKHWQACYTTQGSVVAAILAGTITTRLEIDAAFL